MRKTRTNPTSNCVKFHLFLLWQNYSHISRSFWHFDKEHDRVLCIVCLFFRICWILILRFYTHFSGPTKLKTSVFFVFFCSFSKFAKIALNFKENFENFHLQRPQNFFKYGVFYIDSKISTFSGPKIFPSMVFSTSTQKCLFFLFFFGLSHNFQKSP